MLAHLMKNGRNVIAMAPRSGFEPESKPRQGFMIGHYTTGALPFQENR